MSTFRHEFKLCNNSVVNAQTDKYWQGWMYCPVCGDTQMIGNSFACGFLADYYQVFAFCHTNPFCGCKIDTLKKFGCVCRPH